MTIERNRLLLRFEEALRRVNQEIIDPEIPRLTMDELCPVIRLGARARADYLKELFHTASDFGDEIPPAEQIEKIRMLRVTYEEFAAGAQALETAIERGYLEIAE